VLNVRNGGMGILAYDVMEIYYSMDIQIINLYEIMDE